MPVGLKDEVGQLADILRSAALPAENWSLMDCH